MLLCVLSSLVITMLRKREKDSLLLYFSCVVDVYDLCLFLVVSMVGVWSVIVPFPCHTQWPLVKTLWDRLHGFIKTSMSDSLDFNVLPSLWSL